MKMIVVLNPIPIGLFRSSVTTNTIFAKLLTVINYYKVINMTPNKTNDVIGFMMKLLNYLNRINVIGFIYIKFCFSILRFFYSGSSLYQIVKC